MTHPNDSLPGWDRPISEAQPPSWLAPEGEVQPEPHRMQREAFVPLLVDAFREAGCDVLRAFAAAGPPIFETGWGEQGMSCWNLGGVKASKEWAASVLARTSRPALYFRARGNRGTGDTPVVWYRAYASLSGFCAQWLATFLPRPGAPSGGYKRAGELFWSKAPSDPAWFAEQMRVGYRGPNNQREPGLSKSIRDQQQIASAARVRWAQSKLGVQSDGVWGARSMNACAEYQRAHGLALSGEPDDATCRSLAGES